MRLIERIASENGMTVQQYRKMIHDTKQKQLEKKMKISNIQLIAGIVSVVACLVGLFV